MNSHLLFTNLALPPLLQAVGQALSHTDEEILQLARETDDNQQQNQHYAALQQLRIHQHSVIHHFQQYWLNQSPPTKTKQQHFDSLSKLVIQFNLTRTKEQLSDNTANLVAESAIFSSFLYAIAHTQLDLYNQILLLRQFEKLMQEQLSSLQSACYEALAQQKIYPISTEENSVDEPTSTGGGLLNALEKLKAQLQPSLATKLQNMILAASNNVIEAFDFIAELQEQALLKQAPNQQERTALQNIQQLFSLISSNQELDPKARAIIVWLQLPYSCLALTDQRLLKSGHDTPHYILDEMIRLASQWSNYEQSAQLTALQQKLMQTVIAFWLTAAQNKAAYQQILYDLLLFNDHLHQQQQFTTQQEQQAYSNEKQQQIIHQLIDETCYCYLSDAAVPILSMEMINQGWKPLMYQIASLYGDQSQSWKNAVDVLQELAASLMPAEQYASRNEFLLLLPPLLKKLKLGLSLVQAPQKISLWLEQLSEEHIYLAQRIAFSEINDSSLEQARSSLVTFDWQLIVDEKHEEVENPENEVVVIEEPISPEENTSPHEQLLSQLGAGSELNWHIAPQQSKRCRIAAYIKHTEQYILIYPNGSKAAEFSRLDMLEKLESGEIESLASGRIFEDALASVIHGMRR